MTNFNVETDPDHPFTMQWRIMMAQLAQMVKLSDLRISLHRSDAHEGFRVKVRAESDDARESRLACKVVQECLCRGFVNRVEEPITLKTSGEIVEATLAFLLFPRPGGEQLEETPEPEAA